jgi:hypothetical protein
MAVAPAEYPPPVNAAEEFIGPPTDPEEDRIEVGVAIVGGGPAGLACAVRLGQLLEEQPELAERLGDVELRAHGLSAVQTAAWSVADYERAVATLEQNIGSLPEIRDPDLRANIDFGGMSLLVGACRFHEARRAVVRLEETAQGLTVHHRVHGLGNRVRLESLLGRWDEVLQLAPRIRKAVEPNLATPCPLNVESFLFAAVAATYAGDETESRRLEQRADEIGMRGYGIYFDPPYIQLALARGDLEMLRRLVDGFDAEGLEPWAYHNRSARFDALVALGERERIEADAPEWIEQNSYASPFALRALGLVREDDALVEQAAQTFDAMGLAWHAQRTRERKVIG